MVREERSDRAGALHGWTLVARPTEEDEETAEEEMRDAPPSYGERPDDGPGYRQEYRVSRPLR